MAETTAVPLISTALATSLVVSSTDGYHDATMVTYDASAPDGVVYIHFVQGTRGILPADGSYTPGPWVAYTDYLTTGGFIASAGGYYYVVTPGMSGDTAPTGTSEYQDGSALWGYSPTPPSLLHIPVPIHHTSGIDDVLTIEDAVKRARFIGGLIVLISTAKLTKATPSTPYAMFDVMAS
jgi:hypothetical protein